MLTSLRLSKTLSTAMWSMDLASLLTLRGGRASSSYQQEHEPAHPPLRWRSSYVQLCHRSQQAAGGHSSLLGAHCAGHELVRLVGSVKFFLLRSQALPLPTVRAGSQHVCGSTARTRAPLHQDSVVLWRHKGLWWTRLSYSET